MADSYTARLKAKAEQEKLNSSLQRQGKLDPAKERFGVVCENPVIVKYWSVEPHELTGFHSEGWIIFGDLEYEIRGAKEVRRNRLWKELVRVAPPT